MTDAKWVLVTRRQRVWHVVNPNASIDTTTTMVIAQTLCGLNIPNPDIVEVRGDGPVCENCYVLLKDLT